MNKLVLSAAAIAVALTTLPANAFWGPWGNGPWWGGYPYYGHGYPYYGYGYPYGGWGYPGGWGGYPFGLGYGYPIFGAYPYAIAPVAPLAPAKSGSEK